MPSTQQIGIRSVAFQVVLSTSRGVTEGRAKSKSQVSVAGCGPKIKKKFDIAIR